MVRDCNLEIGRMDLYGALAIAEGLAKNPRREDWCNGIGAGIGVIKRAFAGTEGGKHFVTFRDIPQFMVNMGTPFLGEWLLARYHYLLTTEPGCTEITPSDIAELLEGLAKLMEEVGQAAQAVRESIEDGRLEAKEYRKIRREVGDIASVCYEIQAGISASMEALDR